MVCGSCVSFEGIFLILVSYCTLEWSVVYWSFAVTPIQVCSWCCLIEIFSAQFIYLLVGLFVYSFIIYFIYYFIIIIIIIIIIVIIIIIIIIIIIVIIIIIGLLLLLFFLSIL